MLENAWRSTRRFNREHYLNFRSRKNLEPHPTQRVLTKYTERGRRQLCKRHINLESQLTFLNIRESHLVVSIRPFIFTGHNTQMSVILTVHLPLSNLVSNNDSEKIHFQMKTNISWRGHCSVSVAYLMTLSAAATIQSRTRLRGLEVTCWPLVPKFAGSNTAESIGFFRAKKSSARLPSERK